MCSSDCVRSLAVSVILSEAGRKVITSSLGKVLGLIKQIDFYKEKKKPSCVFHRRDYKEF